jgi:uncharacterized protein (DUF927 family)
MVAIDDSKQAKSRDAVEQTLYDLTSGARGAGVGSLQGVRRSGSWRTTIMISGEMPAVQHTNAGGTRARSSPSGARPLGPRTPRRRRR